MTTEVGKQRNPNSLANLEPHKWKPGESGNEEGYSVTRRARDKMVKEVCPFDGQGRQWGEVLPEALLRQALNKVEGMRHLLDRIEGPVTGSEERGNVNVQILIVSQIPRPEVITEGK